MDNIFYLIYTNLWRIVKDNGQSDKENAFGLVTTMQENPLSNPHITNKANNGTINAGKEKCNYDWIMYV